jgi:choline dehydrogenase-like flavoprotein
VLYAFDRVGDDPALRPGQPDVCLVPYPARASLRHAAARLAPGLLLPTRLYERPWLRRGVGTAIGGLLGLPPARAAIDRIWGVVAVLGKPRSRGSVRIASADPDVPALVDPAWLAEPADVATMLAAIERARAWADAASLRPWSRLALSPSRRASAASIERWMRTSLRTTYHFAGTCRIGPVVDTDLRVRGLANVRIGDASIMPTVPVAALDAPCRAIGWAAAGRISGGVEHPIR